jgi:hypothetical protein
VAAGEAELEAMAMTTVTCSTDFSLPVALAVHKRGRRCVVAKLVTVDGLPVLATAWRSQPGTEQAVSVPQAAIALARRAGARWYYLRDDRRMTMHRISLDVLERGRLGSDGERYVPLSWFEPVAWRDWAYAETIVDLDALGDYTARRGEGLQLPLFGLGAGGEGTE